MPFISETASAIKSRFGFPSRSASSETVPSVRTSPDLSVKSAVRENPYGQSQTATSTVRSIGDLEDNAAASAGSSQIFEVNEDPSFRKDHNVQVIIRIRPLNNSEISAQGHSKCIRQESCQTITWTGHPESRFTFDLVADENVSQEKLFKVAGLPMVENCVAGYNSCMFAYGQTGSGKTHTMLGDIEGGTQRHSVNCGMTPRVFEDLFSRIQKVLLKLNFLIWMLQIREDIKKGVHVENLKEIEVTSAREVIQQLIQGAANRKVAATNMNRASSRSHSVFTCVIESKWESQGVTHHRFARLNLVDLAGSERQKSSGAEGERLKEATNINKSLSTLGLVIMNLVNVSNGKSLHVPYRDSKLTFLLQDSLGGNSKTTIIANISPSTCCSLETLSTLKFAQRAKFIKNNAIVNEDALGDVISMRLQIQQLRKEVSRLRGLVNGGAESLVNDTSTISFPGSPGSFKWEGLHGSFSPLTSDKRMSQKKDYELALVGAFKREKEKDKALQALAAENQAAIRLAKQRADEIQGLKMRLRFREAGIKRLEAVTSGKISAETHLLKEKEEYLKEIEVLRTQVDRNQEVTRFAMENLQLKEEIRRHALFKWLFHFDPQHSFFYFFYFTCFCCKFKQKLRSFYEEGEREMMTQQVSDLQNKLLEALDWKFMHESDSSIVKKGNSDVVTEVCAKDDLLISGQEPVIPWRSSINEENEFLRVQAIQNQAEMEALQKKLEFCLKEKEKLESNVRELVQKLQEETSSREMNEEKQHIGLSTLPTNLPIIDFNDQMELKTMVDAIATASQREAEAHQTAIMLSKQNNEQRLRLEILNEEKIELNKLNDELRLKLKVLIEEKSKLIELYERAAAESNSNTQNTVELAQGGMEEENSGYQDELAQEKEAMQERDELRRTISLSGQNSAEVKGEFDCPEKLVEVDGGEHIASDGLGLPVSKGQDSGENPTMSGQVISLVDMHDVEVTFADMEIEPLNLPKEVSEDINLVREKLGKAQEKLSDSANTVTLFGSVEKAFAEVDKLSREIKAMEESVEVKQQHLGSLKLVFNEMQERKALLDKKLLALKYSLSNFSSSVAYYEQREARSRARVTASLTYLNQKKEEAGHLQACKSEIEAAIKRVQRSEVELRSNLALVKSKLEEENKRQENEKVLFAIDNIEKIDHSQKNWHLGGKATELLKSEEEKTKLQNEMKLSRERLGVVKREFEDLTKKSWKIESDLQTVQMEVQKSSRSTEEMELALQAVTQEKETLLEIREKGKSEIESMILEYQQQVFEADLKEAEMKVLEEELNSQLRRLEELQKVRAAAAEKNSKIFDQTKSHSCLISGKVEEELKSAWGYIQEARILLGQEQLIDS
ncbi:hypothetical protein Pint_31731 [Pistacia integerrima]|uniref:Uncharacterized protein n=1 Tax=Pistacia integerrima TaxID=434235 RepID=A0ACC0XRA3_9ROSI|nr:hypothetical protein Pint_31731 [Pistacia integerrima]